MEQQPVCLTVGGSDSCGGAGIQADLRVLEALGVQGCSAISALTAQNPETITHIQGSSPAQFEAEIRAISDFYNVACIKTGMLFDDKHLGILIALKKTVLKEALLVVDPVLIASSGKHLFQAKDSVTSYGALIESASIWTPNLQEAAFFLGHEVDDPVDAASSLLLKYKTPVLLKGGHGQGDRLRDIFCDLDGNVEVFEHTKLTIHKDKAHGTGCRLASAIAAHLALGENLTSSAAKSHLWLQNSLKDA